MKFLDSIVMFINRFVCFHMWKLVNSTSNEEYSTFIPTHSLFHVSELRCDLYCRKCGKTKLYATTKFNNEKIAHQIALSHKEVADKERERTVEEVALKIKSRLAVNKKTISDAEIDGILVKEGLINANIEKERQ